MAGNMTGGCSPAPAPPSSEEDELHLRAGEFDHVAVDQRLVCALAAVYPQTVGAAQVGDARSIRLDAQFGPSLSALGRWDAPADGAIPIFREVCKSRCKAEY